MRISEVSETCDFSSDTLRYYERIGLIPSIKRTRGGIREYSETDVKWIEFVKCMRNAGLSIEVLTGRGLTDALSKAIGGMEFLMTRREAGKTDIQRSVQRVFLEGPVRSTFWCLSS